MFHSLCHALLQEYTWPDGSQYTGEVLEGLRHGQGTMRFADSSTVYVGDWKAGRRHGRGKLSFDTVDACYYEGTALAYSRMLHVSIRAVSNVDVWDALRCTLLKLCTAESICACGTLPCSKSRCYGPVVTPKHPGQNTVRSVLWH